MTQAQYDNFTYFFEREIRDAEETLARIEAEFAYKERHLEHRRQNSEWSSYGTVLDRMQSLLRERAYWAGRLRDLRSALAEAYRYKPETKEA